MKSEIYSGDLIFDGKNTPTDFSVHMHRGGYLYAKSEPKLGIEPVAMFIYPFSRSMLMRYPIRVNIDISYQISGDDVGHVRKGRDNADGCWKIWSLMCVSICLRWSKEGLRLGFEVKSDRGSWTSVGAIDPDTIGKLEPFNYGFNFFVPRGKLKNFLRGEQEEWIDLDVYVDKYIGQLL